MLCYGKRTADLSDFLLFHVNLDPHNAQSFSFEVPLWEFGLPDDGAIEVRDLLRGNTLHLARQDAALELEPRQPALRHLAAFRPGRAALMEQTVKPRGRRRARVAHGRRCDRSQRDWYRDAIIYQLHVKAFQDTTGDGIGDFAGLMQRLDYVQELGVTAIWVMPFYPSPLRDDGYDISDYRSINPAYGTMKDFRAFVAEAHRRGLG